MNLALESFIKNTKNPRGVILGDMLELGNFSEEEHEKIVEYLDNQNLDCIVLVGENFNKALENKNLKSEWFKNSDETGEWFNKQNFRNYTFLLKGSRGIKIEKILGL